MDIGFKDDIPDDFLTADGFARIINKHCNHPSIIKIREHIKTQHYFYFTAVNDKHIEKIMQKMDPKKAQGCDNIPSKLLRLGASGISSYVSQLVNHCLHVCEFPDTMKLADVSSLYKKNDNLKKDNYRPVSVLPSLSKIYERVMGQQLSDFFWQNLLCFSVSFQKDIQLSVHPSEYDRAFQKIAGQWWICGMLKHGPQQGFWLSSPLLNNL